jgi:replicative DNA helicase
MKDSIPIINFLEAERVLLGAVMKDPEAIYKILDIITQEDFQTEEHHLIYQAMLTVFLEGNLTNIQNLIIYLEKIEKLDSVGGVKYFTELINLVPKSIDNIKIYAKLVQEGSIRRGLERDFLMFSETLFGSEKSVDQIMEGLEEFGFNVDEYRIRNKEIKYYDFQCNLNDIIRTTMAGSATTKHEKCA